MVKTKKGKSVMLLSEVENKMNLVQIGKFISGLRKEQGLTQEQLGVNQIMEEENMNI